MAILRFNQSQRDFTYWVTRNNLPETGLRNEAFTNNRRMGFSNIIEMIDRYLFCKDLASFPFCMEASILPCSSLDH